jgi:hypothetical protein
MLATRERFEVAFDDVATRLDEAARRSEVAGLDAESPPSESGVEAARAAYVAAVDGWIGLSLRQDGLAAARAAAAVNLETLRAREPKETIAGREQARALRVSHLAALREAIDAASTFGDADENERTRAALINAARASLDSLEFERFRPEVENPEHRAWRDRVARLEWLVAELERHETRAQSEISGARSALDAHAKSLRALERAQRLHRSAVLSPR